MITPSERPATPAAASSPRGLLSRAARGFSAAELLVVVAIIGMMVLVTTPQLINFWKGMKVRTAAHRLMSHLRLCRQAAVSKRTPVLLQLQRTNGSTSATYKAWEERSAGPNNNLVRNPNGIDGNVNTIDDERWVIRDERTIGVDRVNFVDSWNDTTPTDPTDAMGSSIMNGSGVMYLKFLPSGLVVRMADDNSRIESDTQIRMRFQKQISSARVDQWDVTLNRVGKVSTDFLRVSP